MSEPSTRDRLRLRRAIAAVDSPVAEPLPGRTTLAEHGAAMPLAAAQQLARTTLDGAVERLRGAIDSGDHGAALHETAVVRRASAAIGAEAEVSSLLARAPTPSVEAMAAARAGDWAPWDAEAKAWRAARDGAAELPHRAAIQRSFGRHDVGGVRAQLGGDAHRGIGARAYAVGERVAFGSTSPDLFTAAHEAAHVVQQRRGAGGDTAAMEKHADDVAALVVSGISAESLLDEASGTGGARIQRKEADTPSKTTGVPDEAQIARVGVELGGVKLTADLWSGAHRLDEVAAAMAVLAKRVSPGTIVEGLEIVSGLAGQLVSTSDLSTEARQIAFDAALVRGMLEHLSSQWHQVRFSAAQVEMMTGDQALAVKMFGPGREKLEAELDKLGGLERVRSIGARADKLAAKVNDSLRAKATEIANASAKQTLNLPGVDDGGKFYAGAALGVGEGAFQCVRDLVMAPADMADLANEVISAIVDKGLDAILTAAQQVGDFLARLPDVPEAAVRMLADEWRAASDFAKGRFVGKLCGYLAATVAIAAVTEGASVAAELANGSSELAEMVRTVTRVTDALSTLKPVGKSVGSFPAKVLAWLRRGSKAAKAVEVATEAESAVYEAWRATEMGIELEAAAKVARLDATFLSKLTAEQRELLVEAANQVKAGKMYPSIAAFDEASASGLDATQLRGLEDALAARYERTPVSAYRDQTAMRPNTKTHTDVPTDPSVFGGTLYHGAGASLPPEIVFEHGLESRGPNLSLQHHVKAQDGRAFRGTTRFSVSPKGYDAKAGALYWAEEGGWVYELDRTPSWDINQQLQGRWREFEGVYGNPPTGGELEQSILAEVPREKIKGAYRVLESPENGKLLGEFIPNPNYKAPR